MIAKYEGRKEAFQLTLQRLDDMLAQNPEIDARQWAGRFPESGYLKKPGHALMQFRSFLEDRISEQQTNIDLAGREIEIETRAAELEDKPAAPPAIADEPRQLLVLRYAGPYCDQAAEILAQLHPSLANAKVFQPEPEPGESPVSYFYGAATSEQLETIRLKLAAGVQDLVTEFHPTENPEALQRMALAASDDGAPAPNL
jgi:hypothetical protein